LPTTFGTDSNGLLFGPRERLICTCEWKGTVVPAGFACWTTVPSGSLAGTNTMLARIPALPSDVTAAASCWPVMSGTVADCGWGGAAAVVVGAVVKVALVVVACVVVDVDVAVGVVVAFAVESTTSVTVAPCASSDPSCGFCEMTTPLGAFVGLKTSFGCRPTWPARTSASCSVSPTNRGTATFGGTVVLCAVVTRTVVAAL
jgi:hypothetical protein